MTEQPPSAESIRHATAFLDVWFGPKRWPPVHKLDVLLACFCEQRVSAALGAEKLRVHQERQKWLGDPRKGLHIPPADWGLPQNAPAERPAPEGPQQRFPTAEQAEKMAYFSEDKDSLRGIGNDGQSLICDHHPPALPDYPALSNEAVAYLVGITEDGGIGPDDVERAAKMYPKSVVVDYTERAREIVSDVNWLRDKCQLSDATEHVAAALSAVASEHQAEIAALREQVDFFQVQYQDEIGLNGMREERDNAVALAKFALRARLREPDVREAVAKATWNKKTSLPWDQASEVMRDRELVCADAAIAEMLT
jgi:hypothetical protein